MASVGFCVISTAKRGYPFEDATHITFRKSFWRTNKCIYWKQNPHMLIIMCSMTHVLSGTVRRFLENHGESIETVVFAVSDTEEVCSISYQHKWSHGVSQTCVIVMCELFCFVWTGSYLKRLIDLIKGQFLLVFCIWLHFHRFGHLYAFGHRITCMWLMWLALTLMCVFLINFCNSGSV